MCLLLLLDGAHDGLLDLHDGDDQERQGQRGDNALKLKRHRAKEHIGERRLHGHDYRQHQRQRGRSPQPLVLLLHSKQGSATAAHVEAMEDLDHVERDERHHDALFVRIARNHIGDVNVAHIKVDTHKEAREHQYGDDQALNNAVHAHVTGKDTVLGITGFALHNVALGLFHAKRQRREAVGHKVYPQQLYRLEDGKANERGDKDAQAPRARFEPRAGTE